MIARYHAMICCAVKWEVVEEEEKKEEKEEEDDRILSCGTVAGLEWRVFCEKLDKEVI